MLRVWLLMQRDGRTVTEELRQMRIVVWVWQERTGRQRILQCLVQDVGDSLHHCRIGDQIGETRVVLGQQPKCSINFGSRRELLGAVAV